MPQLHLRLSPLSHPEGFARRPVYTVQARLIHHVGPSPYRPVLPFSNFTDHDNLNIGVGVCCFQFGFITGRDACRGGACPGRGDVPAGEFYEAHQTDQCFRNKCIQRAGGSWVNGAYAILWGCNASLDGHGEQCAPPGKAVMQLHDNAVYREDRPCRFESGCDIACGMEQTNTSMLSVRDFQRKCGRAVGTTVNPVPSAAEIERMSRALLFPTSDPVDARMLADP